MGNPVITSEQRQAAAVVGAMYLLVYVFSFFVQLYAHGTLIVYDDAVATAQNIRANELLYRLGVAVELLTFGADVLLSVSLYVILAAYGRYMALLAVSLRLVAAAVCVMMAAGSFDATRVLGEAGYLKAFEPGQLYALARLGTGAHVATYYVGWIFLGAGSTLFGFLWLRSHLIPRALSLLGIAGSFLLTTGSLAYLVFPQTANIVYPGLLIPLFLFEISMGVLLLTRGLRHLPPTMPSHS